jgi:uncharacterized membrane protein YjjB (DUF3815 family)
MSFVPGFGLFVVRLFQALSSSTLTPYFFAMSFNVSPLLTICIFGSSSFFTSFLASFLACLLASSLSLIIKTSPALITLLFRLFHLFKSSTVTRAF